jgi:alkylhydroperoxidase family enzyme
MEARMDYAKAAPGIMRAMNGLDSYLANCGLEPRLRELVKLRASQINGCA